jgi:prepilin-type N-terminal cleavage/methylation domain-containing protein
MKTNKKFTLIELMVVVAIICILISILAPSLAKARYNATNAICVSNLAQKARATFLFCKDNNNQYPDRGMDTAGVRVMYFRWAARNSVSSSETLFNTIGEYDPISGPTWVCPLYQGTGDTVIYEGKECTAGGYYGCLDHGVNHRRSNYLTYSLHAGVAEITDYGVGGILFNKGRGRRVLGDSYQVDYNGIELESRVLWSDAATGDNSPFAFQRPGNKVRTNHAPPPGVDWESARSTTIGAKGGKYGILNVYGLTITNYSFDDGSAKALKTPNKTYSSTDQLISIGRGGAYLIPNR